MTLGENEAHVRSSDVAKEYRVTWDGDIYTSTDNAIYWQGYAGYPVLAVLLLQGRLPLDRALADHFSGIDWHALNERHKRDYAAAAYVAMEQNGISAEAAQAAARRILITLEELPVVLCRGARPAKRKQN